MSGILLHPTSLPGRYGIGSMNQAAYEWVDFLHRTRQSIWQVLPLGPTGYGDSPYQSFSSFAGNPYLISLEDLVSEGLLDHSVLDEAPDFPEDRADFGAIYHWKRPVLRQAAARFVERAAPEQQEEFDRFCQENAEWLDDFALFMASKTRTTARPGPSGRCRCATAAPPRLPRRPPPMPPPSMPTSLTSGSSIASGPSSKPTPTKAKSASSATSLSSSRSTAPTPGPTPVSSSWTISTSPPSLQACRRTTSPPPDKLWGNPLYRWKTMRKNGYAWWLRRIRRPAPLRHRARRPLPRLCRPLGSARRRRDRRKRPVGQSPGADFFEVVQKELGEPAHHRRGPGRDHARRDRAAQPL